MNWLLQGGQQESIALAAVNLGHLSTDEKKAYKILQEQHKVAKLGLDKNAKAWADKQVPLSSPVKPIEAEKWDRAYLKALSELMTNQCYEDDKGDGVIAKCQYNRRVSDVSDNLIEKAEPCNAAYWKELIKQVSNPKIQVAESTEEYQFYYIRNGMQGLTTPSPFLSKEKIDSSRNQDNLSWDEKGNQLHSDVNDALVVFDKKGNLIEVFRLSVPIISDVNKRVTVDGKKIDANTITGYRYVGKAPTQYAVNAWDGEKVAIYRNSNFDYYGLAVQDKYRTAGRIFVDIHGPGYTYGCIEAVESLKRDPLTGKCQGMQETTTVADENLPNYTSFLAKDLAGRPIELRPGGSRRLGTMRVVSP